MTGNLRHAYYLLSVLALFSVVWLKTASGETNLPPLEPSVRWGLNLLFANLALSYVLLMRHRGGGRISKPIWFFYVGVASVFLFLPPVFSGDLYEYLIRGRIFALHGQSPYAHFPAEFPQDLFFRYSIWQHTPDAYGPLFLYAKSIPALLFRHSMVGMIAAMKAITFLSAAAAIWLFGRLVEEIKTEDKNRLRRLFAFSPLLVVATLMDGLNDIVMTAFVLGSVYFLWKRKTTRAYFLWTCAFLVKYTAILVLPFLIVMTVKLEWQDNGRFPLKLLFGQALWTAALMAAFYLPVWAGSQTFGMVAQLGQRFYTNTVPYAAQQALSLLGLQVPDHLLRIAFLIFFLGVYIYLLYGFWREKKDTLRRLVFSLAFMHLAFYFSLSTPFTYNYLIWGLPWVILCEWPLSTWLVSVYSFAGVFSYFKRINYLMLLAAILYAGVWACQKWRGRLPAQRGVS